MPEKCPECGAECKSSDTKGSHKTWEWRCGAYAYQFGDGPRTFGESVKCKNRQLQTANARNAELEKELGDTNELMFAYEQTRSPKTLLHEQLLVKVRELEAVVDKLDATADGVPIVHGMVVFHNVGNLGEPEEVQVVGIKVEFGVATCVSVVDERYQVQDYRPDDLYFTLAAAEAAKVMA